MKKILILLLIFILSVGLTSGEAADFSRVGSTVAQFLKIPVGARGAALGGAYAAAGEDVFAMAWNPAGIAKITRTTIGGAYKSYIADLQFGFVGIALPLQDQSTFGISAAFLTSDPIEINTIIEPNGTGTYYDYSDFVIGITYSRWMTDRLTVGASIKYIRQSIYREDATALAFDIGSQFDTGLYGTRLAMSISNFGSKMRMDGPDINTISDTQPYLEGNRDTESRLKTKDWPLPLLFRMGILMDIYGGKNPNFHDEKNRVTLMLDANDPIDHNLRGNVGIEYNWNNVLALRGGRYINYDDNTLGFTFGGGVNINYGGNNIIIDYAYQDFGLLDSVHQYSFILYF